MKAGPFAFRPSSTIETRTSSFSLDTSQCINKRSTSCQSLSMFALGRLLPSPRLHSFIQPINHYRAFLTGSLSLFHPESFCVSVTHLPVLFTSRNFPERKLTYLWSTEATPLFPHIYYQTIGECEGLATPTHPVPLRPVHSWVAGGRQLKRGPHS